MKYIKALIIALKFRFHMYELKTEYFPKIKWIKSIKKYIVFCPHYGEYICNNGLCSNPFCPERINNEN